MKMILLITIMREGILRMGVSLMKEGFRTMIVIAPGYTIINNNQSKIIGKSSGLTPREISKPLSSAKITIN